MPPLDLLSTSISVKFLLKLKLEDDLLHWTHDASSSFPDSVANLLECHVTRFGKFLGIHNCTRYKQQDVNLFINHLWNLRWKKGGCKQVEFFWSKGLRSNLLIELQGSNGMGTNFKVFVVWLGCFGPFAK